jgi:hypothetical protein
MEVPGEAELVSPVRFWEEEFGDSGKLKIGKCLVEGLNPLCSYAVSIGALGWCDFGEAGNGERE